MNKQQLQEQFAILKNQIEPSQAPPLLPQGFAHMSLQEILRIMNASTAHEDK